MLIIFSQKSDVSTCSKECSKVNVKFLPNSFVAHQCIFAESSDFEMRFFVILFCFQHQKIRLRSNVSIVNNKVEILLNKCSTNSVKCRLVYVNY